MNKKIILRTFLSLFISSIIVFPSFAGKHLGEQRMINSTIKFLSPRGQCITDSTGITYIIDGRPTHLDIVYAAEYWGTYPLYLPTATVPVVITITNVGPRAKAKLSAKMEAYAINLDGSDGAPLIMPPQKLEVEVARGETKVIDGSFTLPSAGKNLNRFVLKLYHHQNTKNDASLIMQKEGIFCPPETLE
jgi:hypothetical protein